MGGRAARGPAATRRVNFLISSSLGRSGFGAGKRVGENATPALYTPTAPYARTGILWRRSGDAISFGRLSRSPGRTGRRGRIMSRLAVQHLTKRFATPQGPLTAIEDVSLAVEEGEFLSIIGPSGCGKSTLFNIVGGLLPAEEGQVLIDGAPVAGGHRDIGMVFQEESTFP